MNDVRRGSLRSVSVYYRTLAPKAGLPFFSTTPFPLAGNFLLIFTKAHIPFTTPSWQPISFRILLIFHLFSFLLSLPCPLLPHTSSLGHGFYTVRNCIFFNFGFSSGLSWEHNVSYLNLTRLEYMHCWDIEMELKVFTPTSVCSRAFLPNTLSTFIYFTALWRYT